jgi:hypothetical protein
MRTMLRVALPVLAIAIALCWPWTRSPEPGALAPMEPAAVPATPIVEGLMALPRTADDAPGEPLHRESVDGSQGLRGRTIAATGELLAHVVIAAIPAPTMSPMALAMQAERGVLPAPVATTRSASDGSFALELPPGAAGTVLELWALQDNHADTMWTQRSLARNEWRDLGDLRLAPAFPVDGMVVDAAGQPIAGARITARSSNGSLRQLPDRGDDATVRSDLDGRFRITHLGKGSCWFAAEADGHARCERDQQQVFDDQPNELLLTLLPGGAAEGIVVDSAGATIAGAVVIGEAEEPANLARPTTRSDAFGRFTLTGLDRGSWQLRASAPGHQTAATGPATAGARGLRLQLAACAQVRLRVTDLRGRPLQRYTVTARPPSTQPTAAMWAMAPVAVEPDQVRDGTFTLDGFEDGTWQLEVRAPAQALTFSAPFEVHHARLVEVTVAVRAGGSIAGQVLDAHGKAVAGARVHSQPDGHGDGELGSVFRNLQVWDVSDAEAGTDASGRFELRHLAPGSYQLRIDRSNCMPCFVRGLLVHEGGATEVPVQRLAAGCAVTGTVRHEQGPAADVFVHVLAIDVGDLPAGYAIEQAADADGRFGLPMRLRPGRYAAMAGRRLPDNRFQEDADREASRQEFTIAAEQDRLEITLRFVQ